MSTQLKTCMINGVKSMKMVGRETIHPHHNRHAPEIDSGPLHICFKLIIDELTADIYVGVVMYMFTDNLVSLYKLSLSMKLKLYIVRVLGSQYFPNK